MITYVDSSSLARAYLPDEDGHDHARELLDREDLTLVTGTWTRVEVTSALCRASKGRRLHDLEGVLALLDLDLSGAGPITLVQADPAEIERVAIDVVRAHAIRALDALHLAVANLTVPQLAAALSSDRDGEDGEPAPLPPRGFATRDSGQEAAAVALGYIPV